MTRIALAFLLLAGLAVQTAAAQDGDPAKGMALAQQKCARCHDISKGSDFKKMPPSFQSIAIYRTKMDIWGRIIAPSPHVGMPDMNWTLDAEQVQDLLAYILSLDQPVVLQK